MKIFIVGGKGGTHVATSFAKAAIQIGMAAEHFDHAEAYSNSRLLQSLAWRFRGRYPLNTESFAERILAACVRQQPDILLTTGISPISLRVLTEIRKLNIKVYNFLTDDPWNSTQYAPWFIKALSAYDVIFTPRRSNMNELIAAGGRKVIYLPFGYDAELFHNTPAPKKGPGDAADIVYVGGADKDRIPYIKAILDRKMKLALYGNYWERYRLTRASAMGRAEPETIRQATLRSKVALCLVRRANRDGHVMRSFEIPAAGGCMLAEDTEEHREIFGEEGRAVLYFRSIEEMTAKLQRLLSNEIERKRLAGTAHEIITGQPNTYKDRLKFMIQAEMKGMG